MMDHISTMDANQLTAECSHATQVEGNILELQRQSFRSRVFVNRDEAH